MDILLYISIFFLIGIINCSRNGNLNFDELSVEQMQSDIGDETLGEVTANDIPVGNNLNGYYDECAFLKIVDELGLR